VRLPKSNGSVALGIYLTVGLHLLWILLSFPLTVMFFERADPAVSALIFLRWLGVASSLGLNQLVYVLPLMFILVAMRQRSTLKGVCIVAILTSVWSMWFFLRLVPPGRRW
jgi:hypothetical protein